MTIRSVIVEDNPNATAYLLEKLSNYRIFDVIHIAETLADASHAIQKHQPDLLLLDIRLGNETVFRMLDECKGLYKYILFISAYEEFVFKTFEYDTIHFITKPIDDDLLKKALDKVVNYLNKSPSTINEIDHFKDDQKLLKGIAINKLFYYENNVYKSINIDTIKYFESNVTGAFVVDIDNTKIKIQKSLKYLEQLFSEHPFFFRIHKSYMINIHFIHAVKKGADACIILEGNVELPVSNNTKDQLFSMLGI